MIEHLGHRLDLLELGVLAGAGLVLLYVAYELLLRGR